MLNWFTHNSYIEIPMSQRMALYFDERAQNAVGDAISDVGQGMTGIMGLGILAGTIWGAFGGPIGMAFGGMIGSTMGRMMGNISKKVWKWLGSVVGTAGGFWWNQSGWNSLTDAQKRQLPGFMCLLPKDKLSIYLKALFHTEAWGGKNHARLPYNYLSQAQNYNDKLSVTLGKSEISFTFTLTDNIHAKQYYHSGSSQSSWGIRTSEIGQDKDSISIPLIDEDARLLPGQTSPSNNNRDPRVNFDGYGYIIEGFNVKCCGKVPYTITFYSPEGYLHADDEGELKKDPSDSDWNNPYKRPQMAVWRGQYLSEALFRNDSRLWQNTKNLAKPKHSAYAPYRYPRELLPVPPVDLKDPLKNPYEEKIKLDTIWGKREDGEIVFNKESLSWWYDYITEDWTNEFWNIPDE